MTCIVGLKHKNTIYLGGDSAGIDRTYLTIRKDLKIFTNGDFIMGFTDSFRMGQLLQYSFVPPKKRKKQDTFAYMATDFINTLRDCLGTGGYTTVENNREIGGQFLVGFDNRLFTIESDFQVGESIQDYHAIGCGDDIALGSLYSTEGMDPKYRVTTALNAAQEFSAGVRAPFNMISKEFK